MHCYLSDLKSTSVELYPRCRHLWSLWKSLSEAAAAQQGNKKPIESVELPQQTLGAESLKGWRISFSPEIIRDLNAFYRLPILMSFCLIAH